ncbi:hypothetical protein Bca101_046897 [Brassica carinata]
MNESLAYINTNVECETGSTPGQLRKSSVHQMYLKHIPGNSLLGERPRLLRFVRNDQIRVSLMRLLGRANSPKRVRQGKRRKAAATDERKSMRVLKEIEKKRH